MWNYRPRVYPLIWSRLKIIIWSYFTQMTELYDILYVSFNLYREMGGGEMMREDNWPYTWRVRPRTYISDKNIYAVGNVCPIDYVEWKECVNAVLISSNLSNYMGQLFRAHHFLPIWKLFSDCFSYPGQIVQELNCTISAATAENVFRKIVHIITC